MTKLAIFASGSGSNAENIIKYFENDENVCVKLIVSNKANAYVHERAKLLEVKSVTFNKEEFINTDHVVELLHKEEIDFIILAGFLLKIPQNIIDAFPNRIMNIHPALLPKFGGKGMYGDHVHKAVEKAKEPESGITIHYINENYDEGDVIFQAKCDIIPSDTYIEIAEKVHLLEYKHFPKVINSVLEKLIKNE